MSNTTSSPPPGSTDTGQPPLGPVIGTAGSRLQASTTTRARKQPSATSDAVIGARLRAAREPTGMSLADLARRVPYSKSALGFVETGNRTPTPAVIACYERLFGNTAADTVTSLTALGKADVNRRSFLRKAAYSAALSATAPALPVEATARIATVTHARVWALTATETGLLRWKLGNHTDAADMWRPALPILHTVDSARTRKALGKVRTTAPGHIPAL